MNGIPRFAVVATAALIATSMLGACGDDDSDPVPGVEANGATGQGTSSETGGTGNTGNPGNGPESAGDRYPDAPDNIISERPGGPDQSDGSGQNSGSSGGVSPPLPSPAR